jgi:hypothetical protein
MVVWLGNIALSLPMIPLPFRVKNRAFTGERFSDPVQECAVSQEASQMQLRQFTS